MDLMLTSTQQSSFVTVSAAASNLASAFSAMNETSESSTTTHAAPVSTSPASPPVQGSSQRPVSELLNSPPIPPPRTSSNRSRRSPPTEKSSSRHTKNRSEDHHNYDEYPSSRRNPNPTEESSSKRASTAAATAAANRVSAPPAIASTNMEPAGGDLLKESSTVINQVLVSDPSVDIQREQVRQSGASEESNPAAKNAQPSNNNNTSGGGLSLVGSEGVDDGGRGGLRSRHDYNGNSIKRKELTFGHYVLGQTLGEGEFGKVKLGWKRDGTIQVAIKLIRREVLGSNPTRLPKIYREISILRDLAHPNIVRLHEMVETDRHIGIIMEYASGGELFDHILNNRYLKDNSARRLFAQLISGVGYLHKKGIVHRDLKLENLLLDRNRNIIITDFGFANTFDPADELSEEIEYNLTNKDFVKKTRLDKQNSKGMRRGDLMQTSCGSPCYAAPELVVSDSLYTGRKVDVWSCGVILYAMLAGYLPFDDDPANPDGDNINLLYKYIVTTPLTFPEYVTPHARDLLRRILVPDPRKRADLFEVARHSWLNEYAHIVSHITSSTTMVSDIANATVPLEQQRKESSLARSASVREPPKSFHSPVSTVGGLSHQSGDISADQQSDRSKTPRDAKRRTVQVEYVAPQSQTTRGEGGGAGGRASTETGKRRSMVSQTQEESSKVAAAAADTQPSSTAPTAQYTTRPTTSGSMSSFNAGRLPSRGSYGQPVAPKVAATNAQGRLAQPTGRPMISAPIPQDPNHAAAMSIGTPSAQPLPPKFNMTPQQDVPKGHKRSNTVSGISEKLFGRTGSIFGGRTLQSNGTGANSRQRASRRYPPTSMREPVSGDGSRVSVDSRRSETIGSSRKYSEAGDRPRRFSLLPASFSLKGFGSNSRSQTPDEDPQGSRASVNMINNNNNNHQPSSGFIRPRVRAASHGPEDIVRNVTAEGPSDEVYTNDAPVPAPAPAPANYESQIDQQFAALHGTQAEAAQQHQQPVTYNSASAEQVSPIEAEQQYAHANHSAPSHFNGQAGGYDNGNGSRQSMQGNRSMRTSVLQKNRKFADAYEYERDLAHHPGSSGAARKVMDFFRRRAKSRAGDDR